MNKRVLFIILIMIAAVGFLVYSNQKEKADAKTNQAAVGQVGKDGEYDLPTDWPKDLPIPDLGTIVSAEADITSSGELKQYTVDMIWTVEDYNDYAKKCMEAGYTETINGNAEAASNAEMANWMGKNPDTDKIVYIYFLAKDTDNSGNNEIWFGK